MRMQRFTRHESLSSSDSLGADVQGLAHKLVEDKIPMSLITETRLKAYVQPEHAVLPFVNDCLQKMADRRRY